MEKVGDIEISLLISLSFFRDKLDMLKYSSEGWQDVETILHKKLPSDKLPKPLLNSQKENVYKYLKKLIEKGLIERRDRKVGGSKKRPKTDTEYRIRPTIENHQRINELFFNYDNENSLRWLNGLERTDKKHKRKKLCVPLLFTTDYGKYMRKTVGLGVVKAQIENNWKRLQEEQNKLCYEKGVIESKLSSIAFRMEHLEREWIKIKNQTGGQ